MYRNRIALIGRHKMLLDTAELLIQRGDKIDLVVTHKAPAEYKASPDDFQKFADRVGAKFYNKPTLKNIERDLEGLDLGVSLNWVSVLTPQQLAKFRLGVLNAHLGILPEYRGNAPSNWAILNGEKETGVTFHFMEGGKLDCGTVVHQRNLPLDVNTYIGDVHAWFDKVVPQSYADAVGFLQEQPKHIIYSYVSDRGPKAARGYPRRYEDGAIDLRDSVDKVHKLIRASSKPLGGAYLYLEGSKMTIWRADRFLDGEKYYAVNGQITSINPDYFVIALHDGKLKVTDWECDNKVKSIRQRLEDKLK